MRTVLLLIATVALLLGFLVRNLQARFLAATIAFCIFVFASSFLSAQPPSSQERLDARLKAVVAHRAYIYFVVQETGIGPHGIEPHLTTSEQFLTPLDLLSCLNREKILQKLDMDFAQRKRLKTAIDRLEEAQVEYWTVKATEGMHVLKEAKIFKDPVEKGMEVVREVLVPEQIKRLHQMVIQYEISRVGLFGSLRFGTLNTELEIGKTFDIKSFDEYFKQLEDFALENSELREKYYAELIEVVSPKQKETLQELISLPSNLRKPLFLELAWGSDEYIRELKTYFRNNPIGPRVWRKFAALGVPPKFEMAVTGTVVLGRIPETELPEEKLRPEFKLSFEILRTLARDKAVQEKLDLSNDQVGVLEGMMARWHTLTDEWLVRRETWEGTRQEYTEANREAYVDFLGKQLDQVSDKLTSHQEDLLRLLAMKLEVDRIGLANALQFGFISDEFRISPDQVDEIASIQRSYSDHYENQLVRQEMAAHQTIRQAMSLEHRRKLDDLLGEDLGLQKGNVEFHRLLTIDPERCEGVAMGLLRDSKRRLTQILVDE